MTEPHHPVPQRWQVQATLFLGGQAVSMMGSSVVQFALIWYITLGTKSGAMVTIAALVALVPMVLLLPFGGVLADRYPRRLLIAGADLLVAASTAVLLVAFLWGYQPYWLIFVVMGIRAIGAGLQSPAVGALLPQIVPLSQLSRFNGYNASIQAAVNLAAPLLAGAVLSLAPIAWVLVIDLVTAAIGVAILLVWIQVPAHDGALAARDRHPWHDLRAGAAYVHQHHFLRRLIGYFAVFNFFAVPVALLTPLQVARTFSDDYWRVATIEICFASGMITGGFLVGIWANRASKVRTFSMACLILGLLTIALGLPINFPIYNLWLLISGLVLPFFQGPAMTLIQLAVPEAIMGRVISLIGMIAASAMPLGMMVFGSVADRLSVETLLIISGALFALTSIVALLDRKLALGEPSDSVEELRLASAGTATDQSPDTEDAA